MVVAAIVGYLIGSIPTALIVGRRLNVDPFDHGDGNPGWWNMRGLVGERAALWVLLGDTAKGAVAAIAGILLWGPWWVPYLAVLFAMVGHALPLFAGFRGGRSVLTFIGGMLVLTPGSVLLALAIGALVAALGRHAVYGARAAVLLVPVVQAFNEPRAVVISTLVMLAFIGLRFLLVQVPARQPA